METFCTNVSAREYDNWVGFTNYVADDFTRHWITLFGIMTNPTTTCHPN